MESSRLKVDKPTDVSSSSWFTAIGAALELFMLGLLDEEAGLPMVGLPMASSGFMLRLVLVFLFHTSVCLNRRYIQLAYSQVKFDRVI